MKRILFPTDFSDNARNAIDYGMGLFANEGCEFILFHSAKLPTHVTEEAVLDLDQLEKKYDDDLKVLASELRGVWGDDVSIRTHVSHGIGIADQIESVAKDEGIAMVVMGTQGATGLTEILIGSNAEATIRRVKQPVLLVPGNATYKDPKDILFAADLKEMKHEGVLNPLKEIATKYDSKITILTVEKEGAVAGDDELWEDYKLHEEFKDIEHQYEIAEGNKPHEQIECYIAANGTDMLATVARHNHFWDRIFHTSVTGKLAMHTTVPMLALDDDLLSSM